MRHKQQQTEDITCLDIKTSDFAVFWESIFEITLITSE